MRIPLSARVSADIVSAAKARAKIDGVSLSAIVERALSELLAQSDSADTQPALASDLEKLAERVGQLEQSSQRGRKGKRR